VRKPEGNNPLGRSISSLVFNINMDLGEIGWAGMDWIELAEDRDQWRAFVIKVMNMCIL
jgi:hypothetical protein